MLPIIIEKVTPKNDGTGGTVQVSLLQSVSENNVHLKGPMLIVKQYQDSRTDFFVPEFIILFSGLLCISIW